jgi:hypothetical protein
MALAGVVYGAVALPARLSAAHAADRYREARERRREALGELSRAEARDGVRRQVLASLHRTAPGDSVVALRRRLLSEVDSGKTSNVRLGVRPGGRPPVAANVSLSAEGRFEDVVRLAGRLGRPGTGLVLTHVRLGPTARGAAILVEGLTLSEEP